MIKIEVESVNYFLNSPKYFSKSGKHFHFFGIIIPPREPLPRLFPCTKPVGPDQFVWQDPKYHKDLMMSI